MRVCWTKQIHGAPLPHAFAACVCRAQFAILSLTPTPSSLRGRGASHLLVSVQRRAYTGEPMSGCYGFWRGYFITRHENPKKQGQHSRSERELPNELGSTRAFTWRCSPLIYLLQRMLQRVLEASARDRCWAGFSLPKPRPGQCAFAFSERLSRGAPLT